MCYGGDGEPDLAFESLPIEIGQYDDGGSASEIPSTSVLGSFTAAIRSAIGLSESAELTGLTHSSLIGVVAGCFIMA